MIILNKAVGKGSIDKGIIRSPDDVLFPGTEKTLEH